jgi:hypothetical protein
VAAPLPNIITIVRRLLHQADLDRSLAAGFSGSGKPSLYGLLTGCDRVITASGLMDTIEVKQALSSA